MASSPAEQALQHHKQPAQLSYTVHNMVHAHIYCRIACCAGMSISQCDGHKACSKDISKYQALPFCQGRMQTTKHSHQALTSSCMPQTCERPSLHRPTVPQCILLTHLGTGADARWASMVLSAIDLLILSSLFFSCCTAKHIQ